MTHGESPVEALLAQAIEALRSAQTLPPTERGGARRRAAEAIVSAREYFYTSDGRPDWSGRTRAYRDFIAEVYGNAGVTRDDLASEQAAVRYHVGNVVRERVSDADLEDAGYRVASPRQRSIDRRSARSELAIGPSQRRSAHDLRGHTARRDPRALASRAHFGPRHPCSSTGRALGAGR